MIDGVQHMSHHSTNTWQEYTIPITAGFIPHLNIVSKTLFETLYAFESRASFEMWGNRNNLKRYSKFVYLKCFLPLTRNFNISRKKYIYLQGRHQSWPLYSISTSIS